MEGEEQDVPPGLRAGSNAAAKALPIFQNEEHYGGRVAMEAQPSHVQCGRKENTRQIDGRSSGLELFMLQVPLFDTLAKGAK